MVLLLDAVSPRLQPVVFTLSMLVLFVIGRFLYTGYQIRKRFRTLPGAEHHSWIFGHTKLFGECIAHVPKNTTAHNVILEMKMKHNLPDVTALDTWPLGYPMIVNCSPEVGEQFMVTHSMPKSPTLIPYLEGLGGRHNLVLDDGQRWKTWRSAFNPGFSNAHLMTLVPDIVDAVEIFRQKMERYADQDKLFRMSHPITRMTIDIIGKVVLDVDFKSQSGEHELVSAFESAVDWVAQGVQYRPSELWDVRRPYYEWRNTRVMKRFIEKLLVERWATRNQRGKSKYVIDLAFETFLKDKAREVKDELDPEFRRDAVNQVKIFLFAGHETSSITLCYCFYYFGRLAEVRNKAREEIEGVFGKNADIAQLIRQQPTLMNKLEYITAIIKEVLRMHAPANALRRGVKDFFLKDPATGQTIPTEGFDILNLVSGNHYNKVWGDPFVFRPERWFEKTPDGAWMPFSKSPRSCIGQELAMIEMRITCAIMFANFDIKVCLDELDELNGVGTASQGLQELWGVDMWQIGPTAKPREGLPVRVKRYRA